MSFEFFFAGSIITTNDQVVNIAKQYSATLGGPMNKERAIIQTSIKASLKKCSPEFIKPLMWSLFKTIERFS